MAAILYDGIPVPCLRRGRFCASREQGNDDSSVFFEGHSYLATTYAAARYRSLNRSRTGAQTSRDVYRYLPAPTTWSRRSSTTAWMKPSSATRKRLKSHCTRTNSVTVTDDGRGMPVDEHPGEKPPGRGSHPDPPACRGQVLRQELQVLRRPARRGACPSSTACRSTLRCGSSGTGRNTTWRLPAASASARWRW